MKHYPRIILFPVTTISVSGCLRGFPMQNKATRILKHIEDKENYTKLRVVFYFLFGSSISFNIWVYTFFLISVFGWYAWTLGSKHFTP